MLDIAHINEFFHFFVMLVGLFSTTKKNVLNSCLPSEFKMGTAMTDMQVGCLWQGDNILSVSLSGHINYLDPLNPGSPRRIVKVCVYLI